MCDVRDALNARLEATKELSTACACALLSTAYEHVLHEPVPSDMERLLRKLGKMEGVGK